jgi:hypothetical protein
MTFGKVWQHAKYSYRVREPFAHQTNSIMGSDLLISKSSSEHILLECSDLGHRVDKMFSPARMLARTGGKTDVHMIGARGHFFDLYGSPHCPIPKYPPPPSL